MFARAALLVRNFAKKGPKVPKHEYKISEEDKRRLLDVLKDEEVASGLGIKRYPINEEVVFEGEAQIISWDNRLMDNGDLEKAREISTRENLDLVLVRANPPVVRILNYSKWLLKAASGQYAQRSKKEMLEEPRIIPIKNKITENDLETKLKKIVDMLKQLYKIIIEINIKDKEDSEEIDRTKVLQENLIQKLKEFTTLPPIKISVASFPHLIRINCIPQIENQSSKQIEHLVNSPEIFEASGASGYEKQMQQKIEKYRNKAENSQKAEMSNEEEVMNDLMNEEPEEDSIPNIDDYKPQSRPAIRAISYEERQAMKIQKAEEKVTEILGKKLTYDILKGRVKF